MTTENRHSIVAIKPQTDCGHITLGLRILARMIARSYIMRSSKSLENDHDQSRDVIYPAKLEENDGDKRSV